MIKITWALIVNSTIIYLAFLAYLRILVFITELCYITNYLFFLIGLTILGSCVIFRYIFFWTCTPLTPDKVKENFDIWYKTRLKNKYYVFFIKLCIFFCGKEFEYYDEYYSVVYLHILWHQFVFQNMPLYIYIWLYLKVYFKEFYFQWCLFWFAIPKAIRQRIIWIDALGMRRGLLIFLEIYQRKFYRLGENKGHLTFMVLVEYFIRKENERRVESLGYEAQEVAFEETVNTFSLYYNKFRHFVLHYSLIILWFIPTNASGTLSYNWKDVFLLFKTKVVDSFLQDTAGYFNKPVQIPMSIDMDLSSKTFKAEDVSSGLTDEYAYWYEHHTPEYGITSFKEDMDYGYMYDLTVPFYYLLRIDLWDLAIVNNPDIPDWRDEDEGFELTYLDDFDVYDDVDYPDEDEEMMYTIHYLDVIDTITDFNMDYFYDLGRDISLTEVKWQILSADQLMIGYEHPILELEDTLECGTELEFLSPSNIDDFALLFYNKDELMAYSGANSVKRIEYYLNEDNYPYPVRDYIDKPYLSPPDDPSKRWENPETGASFKWEVNHSIDEMQLIDRLHRDLVASTYVVNISTFFMVLFVWLQLGFSIILLSRRLQLLILGDLRLHIIHYYLIVVFRDKVMDTLHDLRFKQTAFLESEYAEYGLVIFFVVLVQYVIKFNMVIYMVFFILWSFSGVYMIDILVNVLKICSVPIMDFQWLDSGGHDYVGFLLYFGILEGGWY